MGSPRSRAAAVALALACAAVLSACQDQRNEFNPVRILCPGNFDARTNRCVIPTGRNPARDYFNGTDAAPGAPPPP
ncbi:MAG TPA: hypothetical protein VGB88_02150 [Alphaproteobacteria bacterium]